jgi:CheY-like chemotaxis protein
MQRLHDLNRVPHDPVSASRLRAAGRRTPFIKLSAKGDEADRISGLYVDADDYLPKPFSLNPAVHSPPRTPGTQRRAIGMPDRTHPKGEGAAGCIHLFSLGESSMLKTLVTHPRVPLSRDRLMEASRAGGKGSGLGPAIVERARACAAAM